MNYIFYGNGSCSIDAPYVRGVEIRYRGNIAISPTCGDNFTLMEANKGIVIFPKNLSGYLNDLFSYSGHFIITSVIVGGIDSIRIPCQPKKVMDYAELINSKAEDLTVKSETLNRGSSSYGVIDAFTYEIIKDQNTSESGSCLFLKNGEEYVGAYHIHTKDNSCMTGREHTGESQDLYFKQKYFGKTINKLIPTKNPSHIPPVVLFNRKNRRFR